MGARFAGSARLGDRRRRRLAVEAEDAPDGPTADDAVRDLPASAGGVRFLDSHGGNGVLNAQPLCDVSIPATLIIPLQLWKHLLAAFLGYALAGLLIAAAVVESARVCAQYWGLEQLVSLPEARLAKWVSSGLLILAAQLSLLIRWGRSRSLKDFDGQYRVWMKASAALLLLAGSLSTGAHHAWGQLVARQISPRFEYPAVWNWLAPAFLIGFWLAIALGREMKRCRASLVVFAGAMLCYTMAVTCILQVWNSSESTSSEAVLLATSLLGHVSLLFSLALHARHVLYFCADPTQSKRRKLRIPRPHFRWPQWARRRKSATAEEEPTGAKERPRKRRRKVETVDEMPERSESDSQETQEDSSREEQFDNEPPAPMTPSKQPEPAKSNAASGSIGAASSSTSWINESRKDVRHDDSEDEENDASAHAESSAAGSQPDFRGMSKKQRRRLMQELRDRERSQRR